MAWWEKESLIKFQHPSTWIISGASGTGKSTFVKSLIENTDAIFTERPKDIYYFYSSWQPLFDEIHHSVKNVIFMEGLPSESKLSDADSSAESSLWVIDDLGDCAKDSSFVQKLFCVLSHHHKISVILITHNIFEKGKCMRTISLNAHYIILFKNRRDGNVVRTLARPIHPDNYRYLVDAYEMATKDPFGYLIIDLSPYSDKKYHLRKGFLPGQDISLYLSKK